MGINIIFALHFTIILLFILIMTDFLTELLGSIKKEDKKMNKSAWYKLVNNKRIKISEKEAFKIIPHLNSKRIAGSNISVWYKEDINKPVIILIGNGH